MYEETTEKLLEFISKSPTAFQAAEETRKRFLEEGFTELKEEESWNLEKGGDVRKRSLRETECGAVRRNDPVYLV